MVLSTTIRHKQLLSFVCLSGPEGSTGDALVTYKYRIFVMLPRTSPGNVLWERYFTQVDGLISLSCFPDNMKTKINLMTY